MELKCDDLVKNYEDVKRLLEQERRKNERIQGSSCPTESQKIKSSSSSIPVDTCSSSSGSSNNNNECTSRHNSGSASEPENEEVKMPRNLIKQKF